MERKKNIDILRVIGLLCIILAHVVADDGIIFQIRNFDVVLMIIISSYLFIIKYHGKSKFDLQYLIKRVKRLLLPTWIFLLIFFGILAGFIHYEIKTIISTFVLHEGIGYVWIIIIYLIVAILLPLIVPLLKKNKRNTFYILVLYFIYEILASMNFFNINILFEDVIAYVFPIMLIVVVTYWIMNNNNRNVVVFSLLNLVICMLCFLIIYKVTGQVENTNYMKYPFRIYYLSYGFFASGILIVFFRNNRITNFMHNKLIEFISKSSLWIYLWHIFFLVITNYFNFNWMIRYIIILIFSILVTYMQNKIIDILEKSKINKNLLNIFRG